MKIRKKILTALIVGLLVATINVKATETSTNSDTSSLIYLKIVPNTSFDDFNFYKCVVSRYNNIAGTTYDITHVMTNDELEQITTLNCSSENITSAKGIELMTNLKDLYMYNNSLTQIDLSKNTALEDVSLGKNSLETITFGDSQNLTYLSIGDNKLKTLNISKLTNLKSLFAASNALTAINLKNNINLIYLSLNDNNLSNIDLSYNKSLETLALSNNNLPVLKINNITTLEFVDVSGNNLIALNTTKLSNLYTLRANDNKISSINLSQNTKLSTLKLNNNVLESLNLSNNTSLTVLEAENNNFKTLDLSNNTILEETGCYERYFTNSVDTATVETTTTSVAKCIILDSAVKVNRTVKDINTASKAYASLYKINVIKVEWEQNNNVDGYIIYRSTDGKKYSKLATIAGYENTYYNDKGLTIGKTYYYKVRAYKAVNGSYKYGAYSNAAYAKTIPDKVTNVKYSVGSNSVKLSWGKVYVTGYEVYRSTNKTKWTKVYTATNYNASSYTDSSLNSNTTYYYKVRAYRLVGNKKVYGSFSSITTTKTAPARVTAKVAVADYNIISVTYSAVSGASYYQIYKSVNDKNYVKVNETKNLYFNDTYDTVLGTTYYYKVRACNSSNACGTLSSIKSITQLPKTPKLSLSTTSNKVQLTFTKVTCKGYVIYRSTSKNGKYIKVGTVAYNVVGTDTSTGNVNFTDTTVKGQRYYYKVRSYMTVFGKTYYSSYSDIKTIVSK